MLDIRALSLRRDLIETGDAPIRCHHHDERYTYRETRLSIKMRNAFGHGRDITTKTFASRAKNTEG